MLMIEKWIHFGINWAGVSEEAVREQGEMSRELKASG